MTGYEYEKKCADLLKMKGFERVTVTPKSGDQGVDIIAYKGGAKYGVQCKYYTGTVGNKAIQEVFTGAKFYECDKAMVITSSVLTYPAKDLKRVLSEIPEELKEMIFYLFMGNASRNDSVSSDNKQMARYKCLILFSLLQGNKMSTEELRMSHPILQNCWNFSVGSLCTEMTEDGLLKKYTNDRYITFYDLADSAWTLQCYDDSIQTLLQYKSEEVERLYQILENERENADDSILELSDGLY